MIRVKIKPGKIDVVGHAGYAQRGQDIVCAGASTLMYNLVDLLDGKGCVIKPGAFHIEYDPNDDDVAAMVGYTVNGLRLLAHNYAKNITIRGGLP